MKRNGYIEFRQRITQFRRVFGIERISCLRTAGLQKKLNVMLIGKSLEQGFILGGQGFKNAQDQYIHVLAQ